MQNKKEKKTICTQTKDEQLIINTNFLHSVQEALGDHFH